MQSTSNLLLTVTRCTGYKCEAINLHPYQVRKNVFCAVHAEQVNVSNKLVVTVTRP